MSRVTSNPYWAQEQCGNITTEFYADSDNLTISPLLASSSGLISHKRCPVVHGDWSAGSKLGTVVQATGRDWTNFGMGV